MHRTLTALGTTVLIGGSLLLSTAPAQAVEMPSCPPSMHLVMDPGSTSTGSCVPNPGPAPTAPIASGNNWSIWAGTPSYAPAPPPVQPPPHKPLPAPAIPEVPGQAIQVPTREAPPGSVVGGDNRTEPSWTPAGADPAAPVGETLQSQTPVEGQAPVQEQAPAMLAPAAATPATEAQAVDALRSATATAAEKSVALVIVKTRIDAVLSKALDNALTRR